MHPIGVIAGSWAYACACSCFHLREILFLLSYQWKKKASMFWGIRQAQQRTTSSCQIQIFLGDGGGNARHMSPRSTTAKCALICLSSTGSAVLIGIRLSVMLCHAPTQCGSRARRTCRTCVTSASPIDVHLRPWRTSTGLMTLMH